MTYGPVTIDRGTNPTEGVAVDTTAIGDAQALKLLDATAGSTSPIGVDGNPLRVRARRRGTADYDSGIVTVSANSYASPAQVTASTIYPESGFVTNANDQASRVKLTDGSNVVFFDQNVPAHTSLPIPVGPALAGWKAGAELAVTVGLMGGQ